jgi:spermidine synthase
VKPTERLAEATTPDGTRLLLTRHDGQYYLRADGVELMSTRRSQSEEALGRLGCEGLAARPGVRVLVGGLGFGFTLRAVLAAVADDAEVVVVELLPEVVAWNREPAWDLAKDALADPRVQVLTEDVQAVLGRERGGFDAILLDVDNGAEAFTTRSNARLYTKAGIAQAVAALRPGGTVAYWSADAEPRLVRALERSGLTVSVSEVAAYLRGRVTHCVIVGRATPAPEPRTDDR